MFDLIWLGPLAAILSSVTWAVGVSTYSNLSARYDPPQINFSRALVAAPLFGLLAIILAGGFSPFVEHLLEFSGRDLAWMAASALASYAFGDVLFMRSSRSALGISGALAIASTYPLWSVLGGWIFGGHALSLLSLLGLCVVVAGTVAVILSARPQTNSAEPVAAGRTAFVPGVVLALAASALWALNAFSNAQLSGVAASESNFVRMLMALVLCPIMGLVLSTGPRRVPGIMLERKALVHALPILVIEGFLGALFFVYGLSRSPLAIGIALTSLAPVLSVLVEIAWHRRYPGPLRTLGVVAVVAGIWLLAAGRS